METSLLIGLALIALLVFLVHYLIRRTRGDSIYRQLWFSTAIFILVGVSIGPSGLHLLDIKDINSLSPLTDILLGWIGWLIGIEWSRKLFSLIPVKYWLIGTMENILSIVVVMTVFGGLAYLFKDLFSDPLMPEFLFLVGLCASVTSPRSIITLTHRFSLPREVARNFAVIAHLGNLVAIFFTYMLISFLGSAHQGVFRLLPIAIVLVLGILEALVMNWLFVYRRDTPESMLMVIGIVTFFAGAAAILQVPPFLAALMGGGFFALNYPKRQHQLMSVLQSSERPIYLMFVTMAAVLMPVHEPMLYITLLAFITIRLVAKFISGSLVKRTYSKLRKWWGTGLFLPQGALAVAIALSAYQLNPGYWYDILVAVVVLGLLINELLGYLLIKSGGNNGAAG